MRAVLAPENNNIPNPHTGMTLWCLVRHRFLSRRTSFACCEEQRTLPWQWTFTKTFIALLRLTGHISQETGFHIACPINIFTAVSINLCDMHIDRQDCSHSQTFRHLVRFSSCTRNQLQIQWLRTAWQYKSASGERKSNHETLSIFLKFPVSLHSIIRSNTKRTKCHAGLTPSNYDFVTTGDPYSVCLGQNVFGVNPALVTESRSDL